MNWLQRFMMGRYGADSLSTALLILSVILTFVGTVASLPVLVMLSYIPLGTTVLRMFSRNIERRRLENYQFSRLFAPVSSAFKKGIYGIQRGVYKIEDSKTHRIFKCPNCKAKLRLPRGKGKISITCPKCGTEFIKKT